MTRGSNGWLVMPMTLLLTGCGLAGGEQVAAPTATATATVTVTVTATPTPTATESAGPELDLSDLVLPGADDRVAEDSEAQPLPRLKLRVFEDGCGVIRSGRAGEATHQNLTWSFRDQDGFQVLGRNALGETRYRYYLPGEYTVVLEAWAGDYYAPVSNEVTIRC